MIHYFFDRNVSVRLAYIINLFDRENEITHHDDDGRFSPKTTDETWLAKLSRDQPPPVIISGDARILSNPAEAQVLRDSPLTFFNLERAWLTLNWHDWAWKFVKVWPLIVTRSSPRHPTIFKVPVGAAKVDMYCLTSELGSMRRRRRKR